MNGNLYVMCVSHVALCRDSNSVSCGSCGESVKMRLKLVWAGVFGFLLASGASAANGNAGTDNASFNAVVNWNGTEHGGGIADALPRTGVTGQGLGDSVSALATGSGGISVAVLAGGNPKLTAPVPEPDAYAMLLAGLGLIGAIARRRVGR